MDTPRVTDDRKNWDSIDIFLFSNGQQYSPPRKYNLKSEELKWWDATLSNLARSQFGSLHSSIDLYTLDGKKIDAPLELVNDAAYVAVKSPDVFVQTGYEKYLIKAIRSREKRRERMNSTETAELENCKINAEPLQTNLNIPNDTTLDACLKIEDSLILKTEIEYLATVTDTTFNRSQKDTKNIEHTQNNNDVLKLDKPGWLAKRKPAMNTNNTIIKKNYMVKNNNDGQNLYKRRHTNFQKNKIKSCTNSKDLTVSSNNTHVPKTNLENKVEQQHKLQNDVVKITENSLEMNEKNDQLKSNPIIENSFLSSSKKDLTVLSDVYKNTESDIQSVFIDADRKTALQNKEVTKLSHDLQNTEELGETPKKYLNTKKTKHSLGNLTELETGEDSSNQPIHVHVRIYLSSCTAYNNQNTFNCNSYITLLKPEKATQVNIDIATGSEHLKHGNDIIVPDKSDKFWVHLDQKNSVDNTRVIHCKCNPFKSELSKVTSQKLNEYDNYLLPATPLNDKFMQRGNQAKRQVTTNETQESLLHSCIRVPEASNSEIMIIKKPEPGPKHKVSISQEAPRELNSHSVQEKSQEDMQIKKTNDIITVCKIDNSTQTDWCNVLLQAKFHEDGRYTFHLPSLHLLKNYNLL